ncbi:hypothetical protein [Paracoccus salsus]|uniref:thiolase family protein n=1 Tax=Paracoccus salsus TaxID=2911061 RepID=UPI001F37100F|nr:hypothetical protein [Paracoccus salsus]MCF3974690.1 hypothetical protein [Paracoccus salsus]
MPDCADVLCHCVRTPIGRSGGSVNAIAASGPGARLVGEELRRSGLDPEKDATVVFGNVIQAGSAMNPARQAALNGGLPASIPAMTVTRASGSGAEAFDRAGWAAGDVERAGINEAFAAITLALTDEPGRSEDLVTVEGGAIAHGPPIGATGAVGATGLLHPMARDGIRRGLVTLCIAGGQGIAGLPERDDG